MLYIDYHQWENSNCHPKFNIIKEIIEYITRSGSYVGPYDPFAEDDYNDPNNFLPEVNSEIKNELEEGMRIMRMAWVYERRFMKLKSGEDHPEDFLRLLRLQLDEVSFPKCISCGIRDLPDDEMCCKYCGSYL